MARANIAVKKVDSVVNELERLHQAISRRAYDLFQNGGLWGDPIADWLTAERELVSRPAVELRQKDGRVEVLAALPGIDSKELDVQITPDELLIKAETAHEYKSDADAVHLCEFASGRIFRSIHFPSRVDPNSVKAEYRNGMLHVTAAIATAVNAQKVPIKAA